MRKIKRTTSIPWSSSKINMYAIFQVNGILEKGKILITRFDFRI